MNRGTSTRSTTAKNKQNKSQSPNKPNSQKNSKQTALTANKCATVDTPKVKPILCRICTKACLDEDDITKTDDDSISCDSCNHWIHKGCTDLTDTEWNVLQKGNEAILFKCTNCIKANGIENLSLSNIESKFTEMMSMMGGIKDQILKEVEDRIGEKLKQAQQQEKMESAIRTEVRQHIDENTENEKEQKEIAERANNIILHHIEEQEIENDSLDKQEVEEVIKILDPQGSFAPTTGNLLIKRLGKKKTPEKGNTLKPRPVQIVLPDQNSKIGMLKNSRNLRNSDKYKHISARNDLTRKQQEMDYKLRQQLRQRKDKKEDVIIYKGKIILKIDHPNYKASQIVIPPTNTN